jgi:ATPase subunit of ABC transporter with duplicated ATPase domains
MSFFARIHASTVIYSHHGHTMKTVLTATLFLALTCAGPFVASKAHADWDAAAEARDAAARKKAQAEAAKRAAEMSAMRAARMRQVLAAAPYNEPEAKLASMNEAALKALYDARSKQQLAAAKAQSQKRMDEFAKVMAQLTPEQRAMMEKQSDVKLEDVQRQLNATK